jgi:ABC-type sugar transport system permease subunit
MSYVYRAASFFALFFFLIIPTESTWLWLTAKESGQTSLAPLLQNVTETAKLGRDKASEAIKEIAAPEAAYIVTEPTSTSGLASLRKRKIVAATDASLVGGAPPEDIANLAANIKSRSLEKKVDAQSSEAGEGFLWLSAPIIEGDVLIGSVILKRSLPSAVAASQWPLIFLLMTLGAALCAALCAGEPNTARGVKSALGGLLTGAVLVGLHLSSSSGVSLFAAMSAILVIFSFLAGNGALSRWYEPIKKESAAYAYIAPAMLGMFVLVFIPFIVGVSLSFFEHEFGEWRFVGFQNFSKIMLSGLGAVTSADSFYVKLLVTLLWTTSNVFFHVSLGLGLALLLNQPNLKGRAFYRIILILPWAVPSYITALIWKRMFHPEIGAINALLGWQGFSWTDSFAKAFFANLMTNIWLGVPFMMVVCLGALQSIPRDVYEAAEIDGASRWQQFWKITVPLLRPALLPSIILGMIWTFNMFNVIYLVSEGKPGGATDILVTEAYRWAFEHQERGGEYGYAAAYSTIIFVLLLAYSLGTAKVTGLTKGAQD